MKKTKRIRRTIVIEGKRLDRLFSTKAEAELWLAEMRVKKKRLQSDSEPQIKFIRFSEFTKIWLEMRASEKRPASSYLNDVHRLERYILPKTENRILHKISAMEWEQILSSVMDEFEISGSTRNRLRSLISKMYSDAVTWEYAVANPISKVKRLREIEKPTFILPPAQVRAYLREATKHPSYFRMAVSLALNTGARIGEITAIHWEDIDFDKGEIRISRTYEDRTDTIQQRTKSGKIRFVGINRALRNELLCYRTYKGSNGALFGKDLQGRIISTWRIRSHHYEVCRSLDLNGLRFHDLRHTYASHFVGNGGSQWHLQEQLGHSSFRTTQRYTHRLPGQLQERAKVVEFDVEENHKNIVRLARLDVRGGKNVGPISGELS